MHRAATFQRVSYFRVRQPHDVALETDLVTHPDTATRIDQAAAELERLGLDPSLYIPAERPFGKVVRQREASLRAAARQKHEAVEDERRAALSDIRKQVVEDARAAWQSGGAFFAPVLFQQLARDGAGWETALEEVTTIGWRLDSWQVIGAAPTPFEHAVTLIQTLFVR